MVADARSRVLEKTKHELWSKPERLGWTACGPFARGPAGTVVSHGRRPPCPIRGGGAPPVGRRRRADRRGLPPRCRICVLSQSHRFPSARRCNAPAICRTRAARAAGCASLGCAMGSRCARVRSRALRVRVRGLGGRGRTDVLRSDDRPAWRSYIAVAATRGISRNAMARTAWWFRRSAARSPNSSALCRVSSATCEMRNEWRRRVSGEAGLWAAERHVDDSNPVVCSDDRATSGQRIQEPHAVRLGMQDSSCA